VKLDRRNQQAVLIPYLTHDRSMLAEIASMKTQIFALCSGYS
jgi:hypothetical protein